LFGFGKGIMTVHDLPAVNASLNGLSAVFLTAGFVFIRRRNQIAHRNCMIAAFATSILFLACYVVYHGYRYWVLHIGPTRFLEPEWFKPIYLSILGTHTIFAVVIVPMILVTLNRARLERFELHKKIARWTWPLWMYVSVTGVVVYWLLYIKYPQR
jgi:putative membrane protein